MKNSDIVCTEVLMFSLHARTDVWRKFSSMRTANARMHTHTPRKIRPVNKDMNTLNTWQTAIICDLLKDSISYSD